MRTAANPPLATPAGWMLAVALSATAHAVVVLQIPGALSVPHTGDGADPTDHRTDDGVMLALDVVTTPRNSPPTTAPAPQTGLPMATRAAPATAPPAAPTPSIARAQPTHHTPSPQPASGSDRAGSRQAGPTRTDYLGELQRWLARHQHYPTSARERGWQGVVELAFAIDRAGRVTGVRIAGSSGYAVLDRAALDMLTRAAPLPPVPPHMAQESLRLRVPISFNLWDTPAG